MATHRLQDARRARKPYKRIGPTGVIYTVIPLRATVNTTSGVLTLRIHRPEDRS